MKKVTIVGLGFVGLSLASFLSSKKIKVIGIDSNEEKIARLKEGIPDFFEPKLEYYLKKGRKYQEFHTKINSKTINSDFIFITVGTPLDNQNKIMLNFVESVIKSISKVLKDLSVKPSIIIKSTVIPSTAIKIVKPILEKSGNQEDLDYNLLSNPEFLREGSAINDTIHPHVIVIGGKNLESRKKLLQFYKKIYSKKQEFVETNNTTAEMIKYANNAFLATKISFINSLANICQNVSGTNVDDVAKVMGMDPRISKLFLKAGPGYGGSCFPKDVQALISFSKSIGYNAELLEAVEDSNKKQVSYIINILEKNLGNLNNKKIGILGLAFKENTDDIRESVSIRLIDGLLKKKSKIIAHDPEAIENTKEKFKDRIEYCDRFENIFNMSDCAILMTPWENYKKISPNMIKKLNSKIFVDTRRMLKIKDENINLISLGIGI
jgi:UDPglucose 6-dehydrogenase